LDAALVSSRKLLDGFTTALARHYPGSKVRLDGQAVNVKMAKAGLGFDVVPCFSLRPDREDEPPFYLIADGKNDWTRTNPRIDQQISDGLQAKTNRAFRPAVKLVKWGCRSLIGDALSSYYIELAAMRALRAESVAGSVFSGSIPAATAYVFAAVASAVSRGSVEPWIPEAPPVRCFITAVSGARTPFFRRLA
jgi:hypothetical protein